jgi:predicted kinase
MPTLTIMTGLQGSGKSALISRLIEANPDFYEVDSTSPKFTENVLYWLNSSMDLITEVQDISLI